MKKIKPAKHKPFNVSDHNEMLPSDPKYSEPVVLKKGNIKDKLVTRPPVKLRGNTKQYLTINKNRRILELVKKLKMKGRTMAHEKNKKSNRLFVVKSVAWLVEASFRAFVGWILLSNFTSYVTVAAAIYALGTAALIVVMHFVSAHN